MTKCPRCGKQCDSDFLKERGICSECGFLIKRTSKHNKENIDRHNASIRKSITTVDSSNSRSKLSTINVNELKSNHKLANKIEPTILTNTVSAKKDDIKVSDISISTTSKNHSDRSKPNDKIDYSDPIFNESKTQDAEKHINIVQMEEVSLDDPIFLNAQGPLSFNEEDLNEKDNFDSELDHTDKEKTTSLSHAQNDNNLKKSEECENSLLHTNLLNIFNKLKNLYYKRKNMKKEQLEADIDYDFNHDGYYNDTIPLEPYEADVVSKKTIFKIIALICGIFMFIAFIIYYA